MTSQISDPCCDSDIEPDPFKRIICMGESCAPTILTSSLKIFIVGKKNQAGFDNVYPE